MMDERQMDIDVRAVAWEWLIKVIKTKGLGYEGTPSQKREREKSFLSSQSIISYLQNLL
jgi:hypothetical protein